MVLSFRTTPSFVPGASDTRELGVQVDRLECAPANGGFIRPPARALGAVATAGAAFGAVFAILSPTLVVSLLGSLLFAAALAVTVTTGVGAYARAYLDWTVPVALWIATPLLAFGSSRAWRMRPIHPATGFVLGFSSAVMFIKIVTLLHPSKDVVDAVFHAHRLEWVLGGRYYFTQPMPGGVQFPYAIGLYLAAAPWAHLVRDHVALLRIIVAVIEAIAAALLYVVVCRAWHDRLAGAAAVVLYHMAPLPYAIIGNANLTYAFGQSVSVIAVSVSATLQLGARRFPAFLTLVAAASLAFLSHVGIFPLLAVTLVAAGGLYWWSGTSLRPAGLAIVLATVLAAAFATGSYYAHFPEVFATLNRVTTPAEEPTNAAPRPTTPRPGHVQPALTVPARAARGAALGVRGLGWPLLILAAIGIWVAASGPRDRLRLTLGAWGVSFLVFVAFRILAPVDARYQRYADEFIERVYYTTLPAVAILAGCAAAWGWRRGGGVRWAALAASAASIVVGVRQWIAWIR